MGVHGKHRLFLCSRETATAVVDKSTPGNAKRPAHVARTVFSSFKRAERSLHISCCSHCDGWEVSFVNHIPLPGRWKLDGRRGHLESAAWRTGMAAAQRNSVASTVKLPHPGGWCPGSFCLRGSA